MQLEIAFLPLFTALFTILVLALMVRYFMRHRHDRRYRKIVKLLDEVAEQSAQEPDVRVMRELLKPENGKAAPHSGEEKPPTMGELSS